MAYQSRTSLRQLEEWREILCCRLCEYVSKQMTTLLQYRPTSFSCRYSEVARVNSAKCRFI